MRGDRLRQLREKSGYTQSELAEILKMGSRQVWRYENGATEPDGTTIAIIAKTLNVSADYLLGLSDDPVPHLRIDNMTEDERRVVAAMRAGEKLEAIRVIANDE
jgi:transcriptional regulator with XRE-family HTH domain